jgi:hypothetical protein
MIRLSRDAVIALAATGLLITAMAIDHLIGTDNDLNEDSGLADPGAFVLSVVLSLVLMTVLFLFVVRPANDPDDAAQRGALCTGLAVPAVVLAFLGVPFPLAAAGVALGMRGRTGRRRRLATAAVALGSFLVVAITAGYVGALIA